MKMEYEVIVVGAGHAGCEAAVASAKLGAKTCLVTIDMNKIAQMSCNPAIGGIAKGQIVREIDALGGQMGVIADRTAIQFRMLNQSKGPAVWSPRAQIDRAQYITRWRETLDATPNLNIWQDMVCELITEGQRVVGVRTIWGAELRAQCVIITAGTFLNGLMHIGRKQVTGGRCSEPAATGLTECINQLGITSQRMKTGTPVRIDKRSVDFSLLGQQDGENSDFHRFSFYDEEGQRTTLPQLPCWTLYTNPECHEILRAALADSPLYNGQIQSIGPRYCPSIETKLVTFADKEQHPLFLEPEGVNTNEMYLNGFSSSMPMDVQLKALRTIPALRNVEVYRPGYAIEYDFFDPTQLNHSLESKLIEGLFFAGQVNGTTGYEEAAAQGLMAGVNAARKCKGLEPITLHRDEAYIGVLIDDLVTKGVDEPYRMFTSRAEYRILLRQDNADARLTEKGYEIGLVTEGRYQRWMKKKEAIEQLSKTLQDEKQARLLVRPDYTLESLNITRDEVSEAVEIAIKYKGYEDREKIVAEKMHRLEDIAIKNRFNYNEIKELSTEARQKLTRINPATLAQASRIPGVSPSDINVLLVLMHR